MQNEVNIQTAVEDRKERFSLHKQPFRPFILVIGKEKSQIEKFYFCLDTSIFFPIYSFFEAFNFFFKFYLAFNIPYPLESENLCIFYHKKVLCVKKTAGEIEPAQVTTVLHKLVQKVDQKKKKGTSNK